MEQLASDSPGYSSRPSMPDARPQLKVIENETDLPIGGFLIPSEEFSVDLNIPTKKYRFIEQIAGSKVGYTVEVPDEVVDPYPAVFAHGYIGFQLAYSGLRNATARNGKIAITYDPPRTQHKLSGLHDKHLLHPDRLLAQSLWGVMRGTLKQQKDIGHQIDAFDVSGHSMGGPTAVLTALKHPDEFRSLILNEPAGMDKENLLMKISHIPAFLFEELAPAIKNREFDSDNDLLAAQHAIQALHYILRNPYKTLAEGLTVGSCDIRQQVQQLGDLGIKRGLIVARSDNLISAERTLKHSNGIADVTAEYMNPRFNHLAPQTQSLQVSQAHSEMLALLHQS